MTVKMTERIKSKPLTDVAQAERWLDVFKRNNNAALKIECAEPAEAAAWRNAFNVAATRKRRRDESFEIRIEIYAVTDRSFVVQRDFNPYPKKAMDRWK